jgi:phage-related protein
MTALPPGKLYGKIAIMPEGPAGPKPLHWVGRSLQDLKDFPDDVKRDVGQALWFAQRGDKHPSAKPLKGFRGAGVLEVVADDGGDTYRAVYTVRFADAVYVLHAFQKKSTRGAKTPKHHADLIRARFEQARADHAIRTKEQPGEERSPG